MNLAGETQFRCIDYDASAELVEEKLKEFGGYVNYAASLSSINKLSSSGSLIKVSSGQRSNNRIERIILDTVCEEIEIKKYIEFIDNILQESLTEKEYGFIYAYYVEQCRMSELKDGIREDGRECPRIGNPSMLKKTIARKLVMRFCFCQVLYEPSIEEIMEGNPELYVKVSDVELEKYRNHLKEKRRTRL